MKRLLVFLYSLLFSAVCLAGPDASGVVTEVATWYSATGFITLVGAALALAAIFAVGYKWLKGMIFS